MTEISNFTSSLWILWFILVWATLIMMVILIFTEDHNYEKNAKKYGKNGNSAFIKT